MSLLIRNIGSVFQNRLFKLTVKWTVLSCMFIYLAYKLSTIGWANIIHALPSSPVFYMLALLFVFLPIITERFVFNIATNARFSLPFKTFVRKHVFNKAIMNYAGEGYFVKRLSNLKGLDLRSAAIIVKNLALARTFAANFWIVLLVIGALIFGNIGIFYEMVRVSPILVTAVGLMSVGVCIGAIVLFPKLTRLKFCQIKKMATFYLIRSFLAACILIAQWSIVLPEVSLAVWSLFLVVFFIARKSPVGGDLVFVSVALTLPGLTDESAAVAAMLLMNAAVLQIIYSLGFIFTSEISENQQPAILKPTTRII